LNEIVALSRFQDFKVSEGGLKIIGGLRCRGVVEAEDWFIAGEVSEDLLRVL